MLHGFPAPAILGKTVSIAFKLVKSELCQSYVSHCLDHPSKIHLWCLHGNLQQPSVWETTLTDLWDDPTIQIIPVDLWSTTARDFWDWAQQFCDRVAAEGAAAERAACNVILGYSLGGRLALHAVLQNPYLWTGAIAISTSPGIANLEDRQTALQRDQVWASRFCTEPWSTLLTEWDNLPVFNGIPCAIDREEDHFSRQQIARLFDTFSQGRQDDLLPRLKTVATPPILYISGALDLKYCEMGRRLAQDCRIVEQVAIAQAGHRVPWENASALTQTIQQWLQQLWKPVYR
jgi:2-succinyl-6-hydroxy-2,4-cyclohexadiene-1-carboxylate synthase